MNVNWNELDEIPVSASWEDSLRRSQTLAVPDVDGPVSRERRRAAPLVLVAAAVALVAGFAVRQSDGDSYAVVEAAADFEASAAELREVGAMAVAGGVVWLAPVDPVASGRLAAGLDIATGEVVSTSQLLNQQRPLLVLSASFEWVAGVDSTGRVAWWRADAEGALEARVVDAGAVAVELDSGSDVAWLLLDSGDIGELNLVTGDLNIQVPAEAPVTAIAVARDGELWGVTEHGVLSRGLDRILDFESEPLGLIAAGEDGVVVILADGGDDGQFRFVSPSNESYEGFGANGTARAWASTEQGPVVVQETGAVVWIVSPGSLEAGVGTIARLPDGLQGSAAPAEAVVVTHPSGQTLLVVIDTDGSPVAVALEDL